MDNKKELKEQYKNTKPQMGVIMFRNIASGRAYIGISKNINADLNGIAFKLSLGSFVKNADLQKDWACCGEAGFERVVLDVLPYCNDETKTDYTADLNLLRDLLSARYNDYQYIN